MLSDALLIKIVLALLMIACAENLFRSFGARNRVSTWNRIVMTAAVMVHTAAILYRWFKTYELGYGYFPVTDRYESLVFFGWCLALGWLILQRWIPGPVFGVCMQVLAAILTASAGLFVNDSGTIDPLMPALRSNWLAFHVVTCFLAYAAFAASAFIAAQFLVRAARSGALPEVIENTDQILYRTVSVGFFLLTLGILSGSAWAQQSWGRYWGWDPKETWSLITWIIYALFLHARISRGWSGRRLALIVIIGFLAVLFTFFGVNYLPMLSGLHSYA